MPATSEDEKILTRGLDYLGKESTIPLTGTSDVKAGATGIPAPSGAGGLSGFSGGAGRAAGQAGGEGGGPGALGLTKQAIDAAIKSGKFASQFFGGETRGNVGGEGQIQRSDQSLSDVLRSGTGGPSDLSAFLSALERGDIANQTLTVGGGSPMSQLDVLRENLPGVNFSSGVPAAAGAANYFSTPEGLAALGELGINTDMLRGAGIVPSGVSGAASGLGTAGLGAGAAGAILGLIASLTGDQTLGKAGGALGAAGGALGTAGALTSALTAAPAVAAAPTIGAASGALGASSALGGVATGAGAALAPVAAMMLIGSIANMIDPDSPAAALDMFSGSGNPMETLAGDYHTFTPELLQNVGRQGTAFGTLGQALPYVQNKAELGQLLNTYRNYLGTTTGITPEGFGGLEGADPSVYSLGKIPGVGPVTHGQQTPTVDFGPQTRALWDQLSQLYGVLPGDPITAQYGQPGGGLTGEAARRLWQQFLPPEATGAQLGQTGFVGPVYTGAGSPYATFSPQDIANAQNAGTISRTPTWDPETGQLVLTWGGQQGPPRGSEFFQMAPFMAQLQGQRPGAGGIGGQIDALINGGTGLAEGMLSEEERRRAGM